MTERSRERGLTRRQLLRAGARAVVALPLLGRASLLGAGATAAWAAAGRIRAGEWAVGAAPAALAAAGDAGRLVADAGRGGLFAAPFSFAALGAHWAAGSRLAGDLRVSTSADGVAWGPWETMHPDGHGAARSDREFGELLHLAPGRFVRYQVVGPDGAARPAPDDLRFVYIDAGDGPTAADLAGQVGAFAAAQPRVVTRAGWGCDEKLRLDKDGQEIWEREYYTAEKIVIHHTETPNEQDPLQAIRAVYHYHAVTKGWGDIGYNFLVDRNGVVYEGRAGGEHVVGGHAFAYNYGSVGIGVIGSFAAAPDPPAAEAALVQLAAYTGRFIDPLGRYYFVDKMLPNIVGHRDVLRTACPGNAFYPRLPAIRQAVAGVLGARPAMDVAIVGIAAPTAAVPTGQPAVVRVTVKNLGSSVLPSYYDKGLTYFEDETYNSKGQAKVTGRFRIVAEIEGAVAPSPSAVPPPGAPPSPTGPGSQKGSGDPSDPDPPDTTTPPLDPSRVNPYRWGFGRSINPGEMVEVECRLAFRTPGQKRLRFGLVQEQVAYKQQGLDGPTFQVYGAPVGASPSAIPTPNPADPLPGPVANTDELTYFPETRHTLRGALRRYWDKFGGLAQFGYPLTEEFRERNEADGKEYTVQYFERARFELHPEHAGTDYEVLLGLVGRLFHAADPPVPPSRDATTTHFPQTGHNLGGTFRLYWEQYGGLFVYGYPLTEEIPERSRIDGKLYTVQYFERARFEWHPENTGKSQVLLGHLGRQMLQDRGWIK